MSGLRPILPALIATAVLLAACGSDQNASSMSGESESANPTDAAAMQPANSKPEESSVGSVSFVVNGNEKSFEYLPKSASLYNPLASTLRAHPESGSTESLAIHFMSVDLKKLDFPADLPAPKDLSQPMDPMAAMANVGFGYIDPDGVEWAGPGKLRVDSFGADGVIEGTFDQVTLPHTDKEHPDITLTGGTFRARITSPW